MYKITSLLKRWCFWIWDFFQGGDYWRQFRDVRFIMQHPVESEPLLDQRLEDILAFAKKNSPYYAEVQGDRLSDFPVINKQVINHTFNDFLIGKVEDCIHHATSGSTGTPFHSYQDRASNIRRIATIKVCNDTIGFHSFMPMMLMSYCDLPVHGRGDFEMVKGRAQDVCFANISSFDDQSMQRVVDMMNTLCVRFVRGDMSLLEAFTNYVVREGIELKSHPTFISIGEMLTEPLRRRVVEDMHLHIISQYANEENGVLGQSRLDAPGDEILLNRANCIVELLKLDSDEPVGDGEVGRVVVTDLTNRAMPMIRYDIGDLAVRGEVLPSGRILSLKLQSCRKMDLIYDTSGNVVCMTVPYEIWSLPSLRQLQFAQLDVKRYRLLLNLKSLPEGVGISMIQQCFRNELGMDAEVEVQLADDIPVMCSGKRKLFLQCCKKYLNLNADVSPR